MNQRQLERQFSFNRSASPMVEQISNNGGHFGVTPERVTMTKEYLLHLMTEMDELLGELNWKIHRPTREITQSKLRENFLEELIDLYKYWLSIAAIWGFTAEDLDRMFWIKTAVVERKFIQEQALSQTTGPIAIVDIDGVLADYPSSFIEYVRSRTGLSEDAKADMTYENMVEGLSRIEVVRWKEQYREEGFEGEHIRAMEGAESYMEGLRRAGYFLCVVTARPYSVYKRMFGDTMRWFAKNAIPFDALMFEEDKQRFTLSLLDAGKRVVFAIEDHAGHARSIATLGVNVALLDRPYNMDATFGTLPVKRAATLDAALQLAKEWLS